MNETRIIYILLKHFGKYVNQFSLSKTAKFTLFFT